MEKNNFVEKQDMNLLQKILEVKDSLPKKQKLLCDFILEHHQDIGIYTVKELADAAGVGTTTVIRLTQFLGFDNYVDFRKEFHFIHTDYLNKWESVKLSFERKMEEGSSNSLQWIIQKNLENIQQIFNPTILEEYEKIINLLLNTDKAYIFGTRPYRAAAIYFEILMNEFSNKMIQLSYDSETLFDKAQHFKEDEVLLVFAFEPYTRRTLSLVDLATSKKIKTILFTDHLSCPIAKEADVILLVPVETEFFSIVPLVVLLEAISIELGRKSVNSIDHIKNLVPILKKYDII